MQPLCGLSLFLFLAGIDRRASEALQQRLELVFTDRTCLAVALAKAGGPRRIPTVSRDVRLGRRRIARGGNNVVRLFDDIAKHELIAVTRYGPDEDRLARVIAERPSQRADSLRQRAVRNDDVGPDAFEDVAPMHGLAAMLDEEDEQIEIARDQTNLAVTVQQ